jgi:hypothetical protein
MVNVSTVVSIYRIATAIDHFARGEIAQATFSFKETPEAKRAKRAIDTFALRSERALTFILPINDSAE